MPSAWAATAIVAIWTVGLIVTAVGLCAWVRGRHILSAIWQSMAEGGLSMDALGDELVTWLEFDRGDAAKGSHVDAGMLRWLEQDLHERLAPHRARALTMATRPRLGRWLWLVPVVMLLLLAWALSLWLSPPWPGLLGGRPDQAAALGGASADAESRDDGASQGRRAEEQNVDPVPVPLDPEEAADLSTPAPKDSQSSNAESPDEEPPLVEAPDDRRFVVPDFIGDGPKRRALMRVAELEEQTARARSEQALAPAPAKPDTSVPQAPELTFERAAEEALRARHVPAVERAMVRRFFDKLREKAK